MNKIKHEFNLIYYCYGALSITCCCFFEFQVTLKDSLKAKRNSNR